MESVGRLEIYGDTLDLIETQALFGHGLGNFSVVFPFSREASVSAKHIRHPESDWLWWCAELGWPIFIVAGFACVWLVRSPPHWQRRRDERVHDHGLRVRFDRCGPRLYPAQFR